ncbi:MAG: RsmE family RNA methyltransferase, partial [Cruoricaptor ignavus]|nr:RsmE family RNA methyltransferase [Cruoricaptor ignavus]
GNLVFEGKKVNIAVTEIQEKLPDFSPKLHIAIAPTKNIDRTEFFVEKATEMGISEITFLQTEKSERKNINLEKLQKQAIAASKQSLRFHFPKINPLIKLADFIKITNPEQTFVAHCDTAFERIDLSAIETQNSYTFLIGPEGDFSPNEIQQLAEKNIKAISLGNQRLRTETAGIFISAWNLRLQGKS